MSVTVHLRVPKKLRRRAKPARVLASFEAWSGSGSPHFAVPDEPCDADVSFRLPDGDLAEIDTSALGCGMSRSEFLRALLAGYGGARSRTRQRRPSLVIASKPSPPPNSSSTRALVRSPHALVIESGRPKILEAEIVDAVPVHRPPTLLERRFFGPGHPLNERQPQLQAHGLTETQANKARNELYCAWLEERRQNDRLRQQLKREKERQKPLLSRLLGF